jgi:hypothetical protein
MSPLTEITHIMLMCAPARQKFAWKDAIFSSTSRLLGATMAR